MIRVLLVEDNDVVATQVRGWVAASSPECEVVVEGDRDGAKVRLRSDEEFDLIVCDLNIPSRQGSLDGREEYGMEVFELARLLHRGTLCLFFTGHADDIDTHDQLSAGGVEDAFGNGNLVPMVRLVRKLYAERAGDHIAQIAGEIARLDEIELDIADLELSMFEQRAVRIFVRRHQGTRCELKPLGGLSGAKTFGLSVFDSDRSRRALAFGKIAGRSEIEDEERRFQQFVSVHLDPTCLPVLAGHVLSGAGRCAALFYSFADRFDRSLFDVLEQDETAALEVLSALRLATEPWHNTGMVRNVSVADMRRFGLTDHAMETHAALVDDIDWRSVESRSFEAAVGPQHGDLHGKNLLVDGSGRVMLIDFGDVDRRPLGLDPVVLELSLLFHPDRPRSDAQPSVVECSSWADVDVFADATPFPAFVRSCRAWATEAADGDAVVLALAYAHAMRQLKYADTNEQLAVAVARSALTRLRDLEQSSG